jgi:hypothetical protein
MHMLKYAIQVTLVTDLCICICHGLQVHFTKHEKKNLLLQEEYRKEG